MLSYQALTKQFAEKRFSPLYLMFGEEQYLQEELIRGLTESYLGKDADFGREKIEGDSMSLADLLVRLNETGLFTERRLLIVENPPYLLPSKKSEGKGSNLEAENGKSIRSDEETALLENYLETASSSTPCGIIIFRVEKIDRRRRIYKVMDKKGIVVECAPLKGEALAGWIQARVADKGKSIERAALDRLLMAGDNNLHYLSNELEKYCCYLGYKENVITTETVERLFSGDIQGDVFKLSDAVAAGKLDRAQEILDLLIRKREAPLLIFFMLVRHYRLLLQAHCLLDQGLSQHNFTSALAVHPFVARKMREQAESFRRRVLEDILVYLQRMDLQIKTGEIEPVRALKFLLIKIDNFQQRALYTNL